MTLSRKIAQTILEKNISIKDLTETLSSYNLLSILPSVLKDIKQISCNNNKNETILIESPFEINKDAIARIKRIIGNDLAPHEVIINKKLLAGFKARFKGRLYDGSAERIIKEFIK
ncbi:MAG: F0F1 ATP synthase subunit delta [Candidatus Paceibacterota bacterium]|jgi:F0F1-type ATP synthase delta subunit